MIRLWRWDSLQSFFIIGFDTECWLYTFFILWYNMDKGMWRGDTYEKCI